MGSKMSNMEWGLTIGALAMIDLVQFALDIFVIGVAANRFIDIGVGMTLPFYLRMRGVKMDGKKVGSMLGAFLIEQIPVLDALPLWCADGVFMYMMDKKDKLGESDSKNVQEERKPGRLDSRSSNDQQKAA
ncbi:MAG: hypothetical protein JWL80_165 [Parcubacteria group bacterium]|nr:hypothetical protein [Parcubacteria group bacterium]